MTMFSINSCPKNRSLLAHSIQDLVELINERESLRDNNIYKIKIDSCQINNRLHEIEQWRSGHINPQVEKLRAGLESEVNTLEREIRMEEVACWRDVVRLKSDLRESIGEFVNEKRKQNLIDGDI